MKFMLASDIHGSAYYAEKMRQAYIDEKADRLILLGDLLYHGPRNDLPKDYAPKKVIEILNDIKEEILCVRGNCDTEVDQMVLDFPIMADYAVIYADGRTLYLTHGHKFNPENPPKLKKGREIPVLGIRLVTTPMFKNTCTASRVIIPTVVKVPNLSRA